MWIKSIETKPNKQLHNSMYALYIMVSEFYLKSISNSTVLHRFNVRRRQIEVKQNFLGFMRKYPMTFSGSKHVDDV